MNVPASSVDRTLFVPETRIGFWFLGSQTWETHVIRVALRDLERLIGGGKPVNPVVLDAGCGRGESRRPLYELCPRARLMGADAEPQCVGLAAREAEREGVS